jgi:Mlc titration factor MtfA (ptsG expression regulator)
MIHSVLTEYGLPFYASLPDDDKVTFQKRVRDFLKGRQLKPRNMDQLSLEHQVLISASAVTVTFGVKKSYSLYFNLIHVYPEGYERWIKKRYQKDKMKMQGAVVIGLEELIAATKDPAGHFHPGIHEFSLALYHENVVEKEGYFDITPGMVEQQLHEHGATLAQWACLPPLISRMTQEFPQQFFASAATMYFTQPDEIKNRWPGVTNWLSGIFQQKIKAS